MCLQIRVVSIPVNHLYLAGAETIARKIQVVILVVCDTWRIKNDEELDKMIKHENTVNCIKAQRLSWFGHIQVSEITPTFGGVTARAVEGIQ